ncbi:MAG: livH 3 [Firmicutes bacterium]|nr:livH 3 [Bacillota bacterium]
MEIIQSVLNGILLGGLYSGDLVIVSTFLCMIIAAQVTGSLLLALVITICFMAVIGFLLQNFLINKVLDKGDEPPLLVTFGVSIFLSNVLLLLFGADARSIQSPITSSNVISSNLVSVSAVYLLNFVVAVLVIGALHYVMKYTYFGRSIRATSNDVTAAELMGVNTKRIYSYTMCLAMASAAIAGLLVGMTFVFYPSTGTQYLIIAFGVVVIGGMGSLLGTLVGGVILGLAQLLGAYFFGAGYQLLAGYIVLLIILTIKPEGLLSTAARK